MSMVDLEQADGADDWERKPDARGLASDIKAAWEQRIGAEVEERLKTAHDDWSRNFKVRKGGSVPPLVPSPRTQPHPPNLSLRWK